MPHHGRRSCVRRCLSIAGAASMGALLLFAGGKTMGPPYSSFGLGAGTLQQQRLFPLSPPPEYLLSPPPEYLLTPPPEFLLTPPPPQSSEAEISFPRRLLPLRGQSRPLLEEGRDDQSVPQLEDGTLLLPDQLLEEDPDNQSAPQLEDDAILLPDQEVLVLAAEPISGKAICEFHGGASSPARPLGRLPGARRHAYLCLMPDSAQLLQAPRLLPASAAASDPTAEFRTLLNWTNKLVFDAAMLPGGHVLMFAKDVNRHQGVNLAGNVQCIYRGGGAADGMVASFPAISSAQQVVRCPPPPTLLLSGNIELHVTLALNGEEPIPSVATVRGPQQSVLSVTSGRKLICACTMVRDVAKFLPEWVSYHAAVGVEKFILYDNASEDDLLDQVARLRSAGIDISTVAWPWTKAQEAGLSHCAALLQPSCQWMAFIDVDEFIFSPNWKLSEKPSKSLLEAIVSVGPNVGQIYLPCYDFGPSGQTAHPREGVCQGYTCRLDKGERHKFLVRLDAVEDSLVNHVHHFDIKSGFLHYVWSKLARINHYKFQAWTEFKSKFKRRVSTYVADWKDPVNLQSHDRAPGLGIDPVEPLGWADSFCEVYDTAMKEVSAKWFGFGLGGHGSTAQSNSNGDIAPSPSLP